MRFLVPLAILLALAAYTTATINQVDARTFSIEGPIVGGGSDAPNRRAAMRVCPGGYYVLKRSEERNKFAEIGVATNWTIRCI